MEVSGEYAAGIRGLEGGMDLKRVTRNLQVKTVIIQGSLRERGINKWMVAGGS